MNPNRGGSERRTSSKLAAFWLSWLEKSGASLRESVEMAFQHINLPFKFPLKVAQAELPAQTVLLLSFCPWFSDFLTANPGACQAPTRDRAATSADRAPSSGQVVCGAGKWLVLA